MASQPYIRPTREAFEAAPLVRKARAQIARLQAVIDYGIGDTRRAAQIIERLTASLDHAFDHEPTLVVNGQSCQLAWTLSDWHFAIDAACAELEREQAA